MKKYIKVVLAIIVAIVITTVIILVNNNSGNGDDILVYYGESADWEATMIFNPNDKYVMTIKHKGNEKLPIKCKITMNYLSGGRNTGEIEYSDLSDKVGGFKFEKEYDKEIYGDTLKYNWKESLALTLKWENKQQDIVLKRI